MMCDPSAFCNGHREWSIYTRTFPAVLWCLHDIFFVPFAVTGRSWWLLCPAGCLPVLFFWNVQFGRSIHVSPWRCSFGAFSQSLQFSLWLAGSRVPFALERCCVSHFFVHGDRFIHISSVLNWNFESKTRDSRMLHTTSIVSWIALAFVRLRSSRRGQKRLIGPRRVKSWKTDFTRLRLS